MAKQAKRHQGIEVPDTGIKFPSTAAGSADPNTLDFYAEGTWTPSWTSTGVQPTLGNGSLTGKYTRIGNTVTATLYFGAGSTTNFGTGVWRFTMPFIAAQSASSICFIQDGGTGYFQMTGLINTNSNIIIFYSMGGSTAEISGTVPMTWSTAGSDYLAATVTYIIA